MTEIRDELLERVVEELRTLPAADEAAVGRIVRAVGGQRAEGGGQRAVSARPSWWRSRVPFAAAAGFALAAGLAGFVARGVMRSGATPTVATTSEPAPESLKLAAGSLPAARRPLPALVPTQFVLDASRASRVALIGDFNGWDATATPLMRDSSSGIWTVTVPLTPGRHVYAFMVDGKAWTLDPRAPAAQDPEFGTPSSVVLVGLP